MRYSNIIILPNSPLHVTQVESDEEPKFIADEDDELSDIEVMPLKLWTIAQITYSVCVH